MEAEQIRVNKCYTVSFENDFAILRMDYGENRFNKYSCNAIEMCLGSILDNPNTKALIVTGSGKFFSNGLDLEWMSKSASEVVDFIESYTAILHRLIHFPMPTLAAINGHAFAGGALLALSFDYRVMRSDRGWFCLPEIDLKLRFSPFMIELIKLRLKSNKCIRELAVFGKRFTAYQCLEADIIDEVTDMNNLISAAKSILRKCIGGRNLDRDMMKTMKEDMYNKIRIVEDPARKKRIENLTKAYSRL